MLIPKVLNHLLVKILLHLVQDLACPIGIIVTHLSLEFFVFGSDGILEFPFGRSNDILSALFLLFVSELALLASD